MSYSAWALFLTIMFVRVITSFLHESVDRIQACGLEQWYKDFLVPAFGGNINVHFFFYILIFLLFSYSCPHFPPLLSPALPTSHLLYSILPTVVFVLKCAFLWVYIAFILFYFLKFVFIYF